MKKIALAAVLVSTLFTACKKSKTEAPAPTTVGLWKGTIGAGTSNPIALNLKQNNTIDVYNTLDTATVLASGRGTGTWALTNNTVNITYKYNQINTTYTAALTVNDARTSMSGDVFALGTLFGRIQLTK